MIQNLPRILLVDEDRIVLDSLASRLQQAGYVVETAQSAPQALNKLQQGMFNLVFSEVNIPGGDGFELLRTITVKYPNVVTILTTAYGTIESAVDAIKLGAYDYLTKPLLEDDVLLAVERALQQQALLSENLSLRIQLEKHRQFDTVIGQDYKMAKVFELAETVADSKITILITGASGTGKSLIARAIHQQSARRSKPFVEVSCGAIPESLLESELFGHVKGSFTGAVQDKNGKFKVADGGTIFLDEIATASPALQVKLLRVLQERQFEAVGSNLTHQVDVRVILATNLNLEKEVEAGRFRQDLYYRINVVNINLPSLAERLSDIPFLTKHFIAKYRAELGREVTGVDETALHALQNYHWPGNVRELENVIERAMVFCKGRIIGLRELPPHFHQINSKDTAQNGWRGQSLEQAMEEPERMIIEAALQVNNWNRQTTANMLKINRTTLYKKMKRHGLDTAMTANLC